MNTALAATPRFVLGVLSAGFLLLAVTGPAFAVAAGELHGDHLLVLASGQTTGAQNLSTEPADRWYVSCYGARCSMSRILPGADGFEITLGLHFQRSTGKLIALAAMAPADADHDRGVEIGFVDTSAPQKNMVVVTVPLAPCDATSCLGSTESAPSTVSRDLQADIIDNFHKYQTLTASYYAKGKRKTAMEDSSRFKAEYQNLLAEMKKPQ